MQTRVYILLVILLIPSKIVTVTDFPIMKTIEQTSEQTVCSDWEITFAGLVDLDLAFVLSSQEEPRVERARCTLLQTACVQWACHATVPPPIRSNARCSRDVPSIQIFLMQR